MSSCSPPLQPDTARGRVSPSSSSAMEPRQHPPTTSPSACRSSSPRPWTPEPSPSCWRVPTAALCRGSRNRATTTRGPWCWTRCPSGSTSGASTRRAVHCGVGRWADAGCCGWPRSSLAGHARSPPSRRRSARGTTSSPTPTPSREHHSDSGSAPRTPFYEPVQELVAALPEEPEINSSGPGGHTRIYWNDQTLEAFSFLASHLGT